MAYSTWAVHGTGFVIYDEYNGETNSCSNHVDDFLNKFYQFAKSSKIYKHINFSNPDFEIQDIFYEMPLEAEAQFINYNGPNDENISSYFTAINKTTAHPVKMICVWSKESPSMYDAPYKTKEEFIQAMKDQLEEIGFLQILPPNFDFESHIGEFDTCCSG